MSVLTAPLGANLTGYTESISQDVTIASDASIVIPGRYIDEAIALSQSERMEDGRWFAEIPGFNGLYGEGETERAATDDLSATLVRWLALKIQDGDDDIPVLENIDFSR